MISVKTAKTKLQSLLLLSTVILSVIIISAFAIAQNEVIISGLLDQTGIYDINACAEDNAGNINCTSAVVQVDLNNPIVTDDYGIKSGVWQKSDQTITLDASDVGSQVKNVKVCEGSGCTPSEISSNILNYNSDVNKIIRYQAEDNAGLLSDVGEFNVKIDKTPPTAPVLGSLPAWSTTGDVTLSWTASDAGISGLDGYKVLRSAGGTQSFVEVSENLQVLTFEDTGLDTDTTYYYKIIVYDAAGNSAESNVVSITVDTENPSVQMISPLNDEIYNSNSILASANYANTYTVTCQAKVDSGILYNMDNDGQVSGTATRTFSGLSEGLHDFTVQCKDQAGNSQEDYANNVMVDTVKPTTTSSFTSSAWQTNYQTIDLICSDPEPASGCSATYYCIDNSNSCTPNLEYSSTLSMETEGTSYVRFYSKDMAGNSESVKSQIVKIDISLPTIDDDYSAYDGIWVNSDKTVTLNPYDAISGIADVKYCEGLDCVPNIPVSSPYQLTYDSDQDTIARYQAEDKAGWLSLIGEYNVKLDKTNPETTDDNAFPNIWVNFNTTTIALTATDNLAGVKETYYSVNNAPYAAYSVPVEFLADNIYTLKYYSADNANNAEIEKQTIVKLDATKPLINITVTPKSWAECAANGWFFWLIWFVDSGTVEYPLAHGCNEINANIDASISGLDSYTIKLYDASNNLVAQSSNSEINFNFDTNQMFYTAKVEAYDNAGNYAPQSLIIYEDDDEDYVPDMLDLCPTIKPAAGTDVNPKDGCPDQPGVPSTAWERCVNIYTGKAATSIYPVASAMNTFTGETIIKGDKTWYNVNSVTSNIEAISYINMKSEDNTVINCNLDLKSVDSTTEKGKKTYLTIDKDIMIKEENKTAEGGNYNLQETWKLDLNDGSKIRANTHYNMANQQSKIHVTYENKVKESACSALCDSTKKICLANCASLPKAQQKACTDVCNSNAKSCSNACISTYNFNVQQDYSGMKTLSLYDILKLIGYA